MRLSKYKGSDINKIDITYGGKRFCFNIWEEAKITEEGIDAEIKGQSSRYAFLFVLHKKLLARFETLKHERKSIYGSLLSQAKSKVQTNGRPYTDDAAKGWVDGQKAFKKITQECIKAREDADILLGCVRAFEFRKDLIQTLSSNLRKERI